MHLYFARNKVKKQTKIKKTKYTAREINTIPAATLCIHMTMRHD